MNTAKQLANLVKQQPKAPPSKEEFESFVERLPWSGCWLWLRSISSTGYGDFNRNYVHYQAHRYAYELYKGAINGMHVLHHCDVRACCNPEHLFLGTNLDNILDSSAKGRRKTPRQRPFGLKYRPMSLEGRKAHRSIPEEVRLEIRRDVANGMTQADAGAKHGLRQGTVWKILNGPD